MIFSTQNNQGFAVFDLDHTLIKSNIAYEFGKYLFKKGFLKKKRSLFLVFVYLSYKIGLISVCQLHNTYHRHIFQKLNVPDQKRLSDMFLTHCMRKMTQPSVVEELKRAQSRGDYTLLISSSPSFLVKKMGAALGFDESIGTVYREQNVEAVIDGKAKASMVEQIALKKQIPLHDVTAYSDSSVDLPLLKLVGCPVAVSPNMKLWLYCKLNNWRVLTRSSSIL